jgi:hypothetical protein
MDLIACELAEQNTGATLVSINSARRSFARDAEIATTGQSDGISLPIVSALSIPRSADGYSW